MLAIVVAVGLGLIFLLGQKDFIYSSAILWGVIAIYVHHMEEPLVMNTAKFGAIALIAAILVTFIGDRIKVARYGRSA
jgi:hypothetical protein